MPDRVVPDRDPTREYLAMRDAAGVVDPGWAAVAVTGPDAVSFLQGLVSQDLVPGTCRRTFLLGPRGKLRAIGWAITGEESVVLVTEQARADVLVEDLSRYRIRVKAEIARDDRPVSLVVGPGADDALGVGVPPGGWVESEGTLVGDVSFGGRTRRVAVGPVLADALVAVGPAAATALRIELGDPRMDVDVDEGTIPQESGLVPDAVAFDKGCYLGQELVARIDSRGHVNRRLVGLRVASNVLPPVGATATVDGAEVGSVSSVGESLDLRAPVALAMLRREAADGDTITLEWPGGEVEAVVTPLPMAIP